MTLWDAAVLYWFYAVIASLFAATASFALITAWIVRDPLPFAIGVNAVVGMLITMIGALLQAPYSIVPDVWLIVVARSLWAAELAAVALTIGLYVQGRQARLAWLHRVMFWPYHVWRKALRRFYE